MKKSITISVFKYLFKVALKYKPSFLIVYIIDILVKSCVPFINIILPKFLIDELLNQKSVEVFIFYVAIIVFGNFIGNYLMAIIDDLLEKNYYFDFTNYFEALLGKKNMQIPYAKTEDEEYLHKMQKARDGLGNFSGGIRGICTTVSKIINNLIILSGTFYLLCVYVPLLLLVISICVLLSFFVNKRINKIQIRYAPALSENSRGFDFFLYNLSDIRYGKDFRLYDGKEIMFTKTNLFNRNMVDIGKKQTKETLPLIETNKIIIVLREIFSIFYLGILGLRGILLISNFTMLVNASNSFGNALNQIITLLQDLLKKAYFANDFVSYMKDETERSEGLQIDINCSDYNIEFKNVSFKYPGTNKKIFDNLSIVIPKNQKVAIIGFNGAGKSTFIKLLCRLYEVDDGEILLNGVSIYDYDIKEYYKLLSVIFQDFMLVRFSLFENLEMDLSKRYENKVLDEVLNVYKVVGMDKKIDLLPLGIDTPVFKFYDTNGFEPSGGEQQKIAMARAIYKKGSIFILDEPTAALDPISEAEVYEKFNEMVNNKTSLFISHRLSSCKFCDRILVFKDGVIVEDGTHKELMDGNGLYYQMFTTQAEYYREQK